MEQLDPSTFEKLFREYFTPLCRVALAIVKDKDTACDIVQHVFVKLWHNRENIGISSSEKSYLHRAVVNTALNYMEKQKRLELRDHFQDHEIPPAHNQQEFENEGQLQGIYNKALEALPPKCREVFLLSRQSGLAHKEIAHELEISVKAVEKHITKALKILRERLSPHLTAMVALFFWVVKNIKS
jgi:RNA polymerase sigma-70 factor, ECF subfamily